MPKHTTAATIELDFRPRSYWDHANPASAILQNIKGQVRREMVRDFIEGTAAARSRCANSSGSSTRPTAAVMATKGSPPSRRT